MTLEDILQQLPDYAKDIKLNVKSILTEEGAPDLTIAQIYGIALAATYTTNNRKLIAVFTAAAQEKISAVEINAAKAAASIMAMNNMYFNFVHLADDEEIKGMRSNLRMNFMANPGVSRLDFALYSLAVSIINGCGYCVAAHVNETVTHGLSKLGVQSTARIAAVINSLAQTLTIGENNL